MEITIRPLSTHAEYLACLRLQQETWGGGETFREAVAPAMLMVPQKVGGITAAAFDPADRMVGFVYGITGIRDGKPVHWSHMLAVSEDVQDQDIGRRLKEYQRTVLVQAGVTVMYWTYDPLVARNARVNFMKLGVEVDQYVEDIYGSNEESTVDSVIGTDRFIVGWNLIDPRPRSAPVDPPSIDSAPLANAELKDGSLFPMHAAIKTDAESVHVAIPHDIQQIKAADPGLAKAWRTSTRAAFQQYFGRGYDVVDFVGSARSAHHFYRLSPPTG